MFELYYYPGNASMAPHMLLEEVGAPFTLHTVDRRSHGQKAPDYLRLNPAGRISALVHGELVLFESAAICLHIADLHPESGMVPAVGSSERAHFYKWMMFLTNTLQPETMAYHYPQEHAVDEAGAAQVKARAEQRLGDWYAIIEEGLADGRPYLLGGQCTAVDLFLAMVCRWGRGLTRPPREMPHLGALLARVYARPAVQRAMATEGLEAPIY